jgi:PAS domain S-box-containing protein
MLDVVRSEIPTTAFRSAVCIPILFEDRPLGVLFLRSREAHHLEQHELWVARTVASATAIALRNARMMQSLRDQTRESTYARFEAERRIRALEPYADFFHASADGIVVVDREGSVLFSNPRAREVLGLNTFDLGRTSFFEWLVPEDRDRLRSQLAGTAVRRACILEEPPDDGSGDPLRWQPTHHRRQHRRHGRGRSGRGRGRAADLPRRDPGAVDGERAHQDQGVPGAGDRQLGRRHHLRGHEGQRLALQSRGGGVRLRVHRCDRSATFIRGSRAGS